MVFEISKLKWINQPNNFVANADAIIITTDPETDYWQRTYYGFSNDNAHTFVMPIGVENSFDGITFQQMRIFHLFEGEGEVNFGVYACSPLKSSFDAVFTEMKLSECIWEKYKNPDTI
jgi:regulation of enolase protein 1 (concanavalin A-like superfamily)